MFTFFVRDVCLFYDSLSYNALYLLILYCANIMAQIKRESPDSQSDSLKDSSPISIARSGVEVSSNSSDSSKSCHADGVHVKSIEGDTTTSVASGCPVSEATGGYIFCLSHY